MNNTRNLKCVGLSESSQSEKDARCAIPTLRHSGKANTTETANGRWRPGAGRDERTEHQGFGRQRQYDTITVGTRRHTSVQTAGRAAPTVPPTRRQLRTPGGAAHVGAAHVRGGGAWGLSLPSFCTISF